MNTLYYGDNLHILRDEIATASMDLIYLDPPFNSNRNYNVLFKEKSGDESPAQIEAFTDTWTWDQAAVEAYQDIQLHAPNNVATLIEAMRQFVGSNDMMAYLVMMTQRLVELHRVLKPTGSIYLHCDPTASHYLKLIMDTIFGLKNYRNEIVWKRTNSHNDPNRYGRIHDVLLFYAKDVSRNAWNTLFEPYSDAYVGAEFRSDSAGRVYKLEDLTAPYRGGEGGRFEFHGRTPGPTRMWSKNKDWMEELWSQGRIKTGADGKPLLRGHIVYMDEKKGAPVQDWWGDILRVGNTSRERLGYPTQKPLALLERIIQASSNPGDVVLDPFCGCGTAVVAAQKLGREWIGIDVTHLAVALMKNRLVDAFGETLKFEVKGLPADVGAATMLAQRDRYEFQYWANSLVNAQPVDVGADGKGKKGADGGIDGIIRFMDDESEKVKRVVVSVKSGHVSVKDIKDLRMTRDNQKAELSLLVTLEPPTKPMLQEALLDGSYDSGWWGRSFPRCQIITIEELLDGKEPDLPPMQATFKRAQSIRKASQHQPATLPGLDG